LVERVERETFDLQGNEGGFEPGQRLGREDFPDTDRTAAQAGLVSIEVDQPWRA